LAPTILLRTQDGGSTWREVERSVSLMMGFAMSDDGRTIWTGGPHPDDGLRRSDDGGDSWRMLSTTRVLCLRQHAGTLFVCANHSVEGYSLARSTDRGATLEPLLRFSDLTGPSTCSGNPSPTAACGARWPLIRGPLLGIDAGRMTDLDAATMDSAGRGNDAASDEEPAMRSRSCACRSPRRTSPQANFLVFVALAWVCTRGRSRCTRK
jgi:hypothetical protein